MKMYAKSGVPDGEKAACVDCRHMVGAVHWWCGNEDAIKWRGTSLPGVHSCPFWKGIPLKKEVPLWHRVIYDWHGVDLD